MACESTIIVGAVKAENYAKKMHNLGMPHRAKPYEELANSLWAKLCDVKEGQGDD